MHFNDIRMYFEICINDEIYIKSFKFLFFKCNKKYNLKKFINLNK